MQIQQAMGVHKDSSSETKAFMLNFVERMKRSGFVLQSMQRHQIQGAAVAALLSPFP
jgi:polar amino acid transport system substrate-binding protein